MSTKRLQPATVQWTDCERWLDQNFLDARIPVLEQDRSQNIKDKLSLARLGLVRHAFGFAGCIPTEAVQNLAAIAPVFQASGLLSEAQAARIETAGHLLDLACPHEARCLLAIRNADVPLGAAKLSIVRDARYATALSDLRLGNDGLAMAMSLTPELVKSKDFLTSRLKRQALIALMDIMLGAELARRGRIDTAMADGFLHGPVGTFAGAGQLPGDVEVLLRQCRILLESLDNDLDARSQVLLIDSLAQATEASEKLLAFMQALSGISTAGASPWLRVSVAARFAGRNLLSALAASESTKAAERTGSLRWQMLALKETALVQIETGRTTSLASIIQSMRNVDAAIGDARANFEGMRDSFQLDQAAKELTAPVQKVSSIRILHVQSALSKLSAQPSQCWTVETLAETCGVSRRTLELAFRQEYGTTVAEAIRENRIKRAVQLLRHTNASMKSIAYSAGFSSPSAMSRDLREHLGQSPKEVRLLHAMMKT